VGGPAVAEGREVRTEEIGGCFFLLLLTVEVGLLM
jgi:hypothetical protein